MDQIKILLFKAWIMKYLNFKHLITVNPLFITPCVKLQVEKNLLSPSQTRFQDDLIFLLNFLKEAKKCPRKKKAKKIKINFFLNTLFLNFLLKKLWRIFDQWNFFKKRKKKLIKIKKKKQKKDSWKNLDGQ